MRLMGVTQLSTVDWPGKLAMVVFMQGCNLRCPWCQNAGGVDPNGGYEATAEAILAGANPDFLDGVLLSGGEPTLQSDACLEIFKLAKEAGLKCAMETNGSRPEVIRRLLPQLDFIAIDIKAPLSEPSLYAKATGTNNSELPGLVRQSLQLAAKSGIDMEARTTVVPGLNDAEGIIAKIALDAKEAVCLRLQQFRNVRTLDPEFQNLLPPSREKMLSLAFAAKRAGANNVKIFTSERGLETIE
jgi:pyruvate formate lyase activating enzyme